MIAEGVRTWAPYQEALKAPSQWITGQALLIPWVTNCQQASFHIGHHQCDRTRGCSASLSPIHRCLLAFSTPESNHVPDSTQRFLLLFVLLQLSIGPQCRPGRVREQDKNQASHSSPNRPVTVLRLANCHSIYPSGLHPAIRSPS
jgi:hypothetical protein